MAAMAAIVWLAVLSTCIAVAQGQGSASPESAAVFHAFLSNAAELSASNSGSFVPLRWANYQQHDHRQIFHHNDATGRLTFLRAGSIQCQASLQVKPNTDAEMHMDINGVTKVHLLVDYPDANEPQSLRGHIMWKVSPGDYLDVTAKPSQFGAVDDLGQASFLSCMWTQGGEVFYGQLSSTSTLEFSSAVSSNTSIFSYPDQTSSTTNTYMKFLQNGLVNCAVMMTADAVGSYGHFYFYYENDSWNRLVMCDTGLGISSCMLHHSHVVDGTARDQWRLYINNMNSRQTGTKSVMMCHWTPLTGTVTAGSYSLQDPNLFVGSSSNSWVTYPYKDTQQAITNTALLTKATSGIWTAQQNGVLAVSSWNGVQGEPSQLYTDLRLLVNGSNVYGKAYHPTKASNWGSNGNVWFLRVESGDTVQMQSRPVLIEQMSTSWEGMSVAFYPDYVRDAEFGQCYNGTLDDGLQPLDRPVLVPPSFASNDYTVGWNVDERYQRVRVIFGTEAEANSCNFDSDSLTWNHWTVDTDLACTKTVTFRRAAQDMLAACTFSRSDDASFATFTKRVHVVTNQTRVVSYAQAFRNFQYSQIKTSLFTLTVRVPKDVTASLSNVNVTGNITVLQALSAIAVDVSEDPYHLQFQVVVSSQDPYQLEYQSYSATSNSLSDSAVVATPLPACDAQSPGISCTQTFVFDDIDITESCETKTALSADQVDLVFNVRCKSGFSGNCQTPSPATVGMSFQLSSAPYCPQVETVTLSATLTTYRDVALIDSAWSTGSETSSFVLGSTVFGQVDVTVGQNAATLDTTTLRTVKTYGDGGTEVTLSTHTTKNDGFNNDNAATRFSVVLANGVSVALDPVQDAAQSVTFSATVDVTFTTAGLPGAGSGAGSVLLQEVHKAHHGQGARIGLASASQASTATSTVSVSLSTSNGSTSGASSAGGTASMTVMVAAVAGAAFLGVVVAYRVGMRRTLTDSEDDKEATEKLSIDPNTSTEVSTEDVEDTA